MAHETSMRSRVIKALRKLDAVPVENLVLPGTPDIEFIGGWIELKSEDEWPVRPGTPLRLKRFEIEQRIWLSRRIRRGGNAWVLLRVKRDWLLFRGDVAASILGTSTKSELIEGSMRYWERCAPTSNELLTIFSGRQRQ
jgi:hypothetical protein